jgi:hypothetical protein
LGRGGAVGGEGKGIGLGLKDFEQMIRSMGVDIPGMGKDEL